MEIIKEKIRTLLAQDMVLDVEFKEKVLKNLDRLTIEQLSKISDTLNQLLAKETEVVEHILKDKPYFFIEIQHEILDIMHVEFEKEEAVTRAQADEQLQTDISNLPE